MVFLAYAMFILILAAPFLLVAGIAWAFLAGAAKIVRGAAQRRPDMALTGFLLLAASSMAGLTLHDWSVTPPPAGEKPGLHDGVYRTVQALKARHQAMQWLRDGTFERLAKERRAKAEHAPSTPPPRDPQP